jgi:hypothetical protein
MLKERSTTNSEIYRDKFVFLFVVRKYNNIYEFILNILSTSSFLLCYIYIN